MKKTNIAPALLVVIITTAVFFGVLAIPAVEAQRSGYVEKRVVSTGTATGLSAFADQLAPDPTTGMCLQSDASNRAVWGPCGNLPSGTPGQVLGNVAKTVTRVVTSTATQTWSGTSTYSYSATGTVTGTATTTTTTTLTSVTTSSQSTSPFAPQAVAVCDDLLVAVGASAALKIYNISTPTSPSYVGGTSINADGVAVGVSSDCRVAYVASGHLMEWYDISTPSSPSLISSITYAGAGAYPYGLVVSGGYLYVASSNNDTQHTLATYSISVPASPSSVSVTALAAVPFGAEVLGSMLYVATNSGIQAFSLATPSSPSSIGIVITFEGEYEATDLAAFAGSKLAVLVGDRLEIYDASTPASPSYVGQPPNIYGGTSIATKDSVAYFTPFYATSIHVANLGMYGIVTTGTVTATATTTATGTQTASGTTTFTSSATNTSYGTATEWKAIPPYNPKGTLFLQYLSIPEGPDVKIISTWDSMGHDSALAGTSGMPPNKEIIATCTSGSPGNLGIFAKDELGATPPWGRYVIPEGHWTARLKAKVNANSAAIRVLVFDYYNSTPYLLADFTTDAFSNTSYQSIVGTTYLNESHRELGTNEGFIYVQLLATCTSETTVSLQLNDADLTTRIETPLVTETLSVSDIAGLTATFDNISWSLAYLYNRSIDPIRNRYLYRQASEFTLFGGAVHDYYGGSLKGYTLVDANTRAAYGMMIQVPAEMFFGQITIRPAWVAQSTDAANHAVRWIIYSAKLISGSANGANSETQFTGNAIAHTADYYYEETGASILVSPGDVIKLGIGRVGGAGADSYVGDVALVGVRVDYQSFY